MIGEIIYHEPGLAIMDLGKGRYLVRDKTVTLTPEQVEHVHSVTNQSKGWSTLSYSIITADALKLYTSPVIVLTSYNSSVDNWLFHGLKSCKLLKLF